MQLQFPTFSVSARTQKKIIPCSINIVVRWADIFVLLRIPHDNQLAFLIVIEPVNELDVLIFQSDFFRGRPYCTRLNIELSHVMTLSKEASHLPNSSRPHVLAHREFTQWACRSSEKRIRLSTHGRTKTRTLLASLYPRCCRCLGSGSNPK